MKKILVIDDNHTLRDSVSFYLGVKMKGYTILTAEDGQQGIELMKENPVSLILTDLEMPKVDGYQVIDYAKKNHPSVPVVVMTGSWSSDLRRLIQKTGVVHCVEKPFSFEDLSEMVGKALKKSCDIPRA